MPLVAAIATVVTRVLNLPEDIGNVEGGAIARASDRRNRSALRYTLAVFDEARVMHGVVALCFGGGQGAVLRLEALS